MPSVNTFETDMRKLRRKRRAKRNVKNFVFIFAVLIIAGLIYLSREAWIAYFDGILERAQTNITVQNDGALAGGNYPIDISKKTNTSIGKIQRYWTLFADTTFYVYDSSGDIVYSTQASYSNPTVEESDKRTLIYDQGGYNFMVAGPKKQIYTKRITDQILLGAIGSDGSVAIVTRNEKYASYLTVYDKNGSEIYHWADGTMITAVAVNKDGSGCILSSTYARGGAFRSVITELNFKSEEVVMQTSPLETLGFSVGYCDGGMWLVGHDRIIRLAADGSVSLTYEYDYDLLDFALNDGLAALVFEGVGGSGGRMAILQAGSDEIYETAEDTEPNEVAISSSAVYLCFDTRIDAIDKNGNILATAPVDTVYRSFTVLDDEIYLLGYRAVNKIDFSF